MLVRKSLLLARRRWEVPFWRHHRTRCTLYPSGIEGATVMAQERRRLMTGRYGRQTTKAEPLACATAKTLGMKKGAAVRVVAAKRRRGTREEELL